MPEPGFQTKPYYNTDQIANALDAGDIFNSYLEPIPEVGYGIRRRPGLRPFTDLNTAVKGQGIFYWDSMDKVIAVSNGHIFDVFPNGTFVDITTDPLNTSNQVVFSDGQFADSTPILYMANGKLVYSKNGANTLEPTSLGTPSTATFVTYLNLKFVANVPGTNQFVTTDVDPSSGTSVIDPLYWGSLNNPYTCEAKGDDLLAITEVNQELQLWGSQSIETFYDDGVTPWVPIPQAAIEAGLEAPHSLVISKAEESIFALCVMDGSRVVVKINNRQAQIISKPIGNIINQDYDTVSDAIGQIISPGGIHIYLLKFPSAGVTWAYDIKGDTWSQWGTFNVATGFNEQFIGQNAIFAKSWNKHLIQSNVDGQIYEIDRSYLQDGSTSIKSYRRTPWVDYNTLTRKRSTRLRIKIKRGESTIGKAYLRWADNGDKEWSPYLELDLTPLGNRNFVADLSRLGTYHSRKYEISITDDTDLCVVYVEEEVTKLRF